MNFCLCSEDGPSWKTRSAYVCFAAAQMLALGSMYFITPVKQAIFFDMVGVSEEPAAKSLVLAVLVPLVLVYGILVSLLRDPRLLMLVVGGSYALVYLIIALWLEGFLGAPKASLPWVLYMVTETRAIIILPLIWSIVNDVTDPQFANDLYPMLICAMNCGGVCGAFVAVKVTSLGGEVGLLLAQSGVLLAVVVLTWSACSLLQSADRQQLQPASTSDGQLSTEERKTVDELGLAPVSGGNAANERTALLEQRVSASSEKHSQGLMYEAFEGLWLLLSRPYAFMVFWVSYAVLMPRTILDYKNGVEVHNAFSREQQIVFWGRMFMFQNSLGAAVATFGTRSILACLGSSVALLVLPLVTFACVVAVCLRPGLWASTAAVVVTSVAAYSLNSPIKEMLYIRTSRGIKYKAKSWSEMYGNEVMKLLGAQVNLWVNNENATCSSNCFHPLVTAVIVGLWVVVWLRVAVDLGSAHRRLEHDDAIVV